MNRRSGTVRVPRPRRRNRTSRTGRPGSHYREKCGMHSTSCQSLLHFSASRDMACANVRPFIFFFFFHSFPLCLFLLFPVATFRYLAARKSSFSQRLFTTGSGMLDCRRPHGTRDARRQCCDLCASRRTVIFTIISRFVRYFARFAFSFSRSQTGD